MADPQLITLCGSLSLHASPVGAAMHNAGYQEAGLPYTYVPFSLKEKQLPAALSGMRALGIRGFGISMPFKLSVIPLLDELAPLARAIGAVNTVVNQDGKLTGHNTDAQGAVRALEEVVALAGRSVLVLGTGGAARAVAYGLCDSGASVHVAGRDPEKARRIAADIRAANVGEPAAGGLDFDIAGFEVVVNATSLGMDASPGLAVSPALLSERQVVMDIVYKPLETELVLQCRARSVPVVHGGRMLLHQAARQFELYTGVAAPLAAMDQALGRFIGR